MQRIPESIQKPTVCFHTLKGSDMKQTLLSCVCVHAHVKDRQKWLLDRMEEPLLKDIVEIPFLPEVFSQPRCIFFVVPAYHVTRNGQAGEACCWAGLFQLWQWAIALILSRNLFMLPLTFNMFSPKQQLPHQHLPNIKGYKKSAPKTTVVQSSASKIWKRLTFHTQGLQVTAQWLKLTVTSKWRWSSLLAKVEPTGPGHQLTKLLKVWNWPWNIKRPIVVTKSTRTNTHIICYQF